MWSWPASRIVNEQYRMPLFVPDSSTQYRWQEHQIEQRLVCCLKSFAVHGVAAPGVVRTQWFP
jgi:hypothetical protein